jgi:hypothetical protein
MKERQDFADQLKLEASARAGANWFLWIAVLSIINTVMALARENFQFVCGLGITALVDQVAIQLRKSGDELAIVISGFIAGVFALFGVFGRKGMKWAFYAGMPFYALDGLLLLALGDILSAGFHVWALLGIFRGLKALNQLALSEPQEPAGAYRNTLNESSPISF